MPTRRDIFTNGNIYHIFNKTIDKKDIFNNKYVSQYFLDLLEYYRSSKVTLKYSQFRKLNDVLRLPLLKEIHSEKYFRIELLAFCLMPNHFHLLLKQKQEEGIVRFMANSINSVTRFYNILSERKGPVFFTQFRSRRIITREQFMHVSRYIHLNPYSSGIVKTYEELMQYPLSSLRYYIQPDNQSICNTKLVLDEFSNNTQSYKDFVIDNAEYQKTLDHIKHIDKWI